MNNIMNTRRVFLSLFLLLSFVAGSSLVNAREDRIILPYDRQPDVSNEVGMGYARLLAEMANAKFLGNELAGGGPRRTFFRDAFGPTFHRGRLGKNQVKVLVIGQDGTHIAEAAGRTFTGGTGGRVQHLLDHLGITESYLFINTFAYTIKGQAADYAPVMIKNREGEWEMKTRSIWSQKGYLMAQHPDSPIVQWRNAELDYIFDNNRESLQLVVCIGSAARDTLATYIRSRGGKVGTLIPKTTEIQTIRYRSVYNQGNRSVTVPVDANGNNLLGSDPRDFDYKGKRGKDKYEAQMKDFLGKVDAEMLDRLALNRGGETDNGLIDLAQLGSDLRRITVAGQRNTLQGLVVNGRPLELDVQVSQWRHPGSMSPGLEKNFQTEFIRLRRLKEKRGWAIVPDKDGVAKYLVPEAEFSYSRKPIPAIDFPFGLGEGLIVDKSLASRSAPTVIEFGSRNRGKYSDAAMEKAKKALPAKGVRGSGSDRPWEPSRVDWDKFDISPNEEKWYRLLTDLDLEAVFKPKPGKTFKKHGIGALNVRSAPGWGAFGHFRGTFEKPEILVLADPVDIDDIKTARALTGARGQKLQGFLEGLGVRENHLILKTVPFDMHGTSEDEWKQTLKVTRKWRKNLVEEVVRSERPRLILTLGKWADKEIKRMDTKGIPVISATGEGGFAKAYSKIKKVRGFVRRSTELITRMRSIPRAHLPFMLQYWVGTSGDRVIRSTGKYKGTNYRLVVPNWVVSTPAPTRRLEDVYYLAQSRHMLVEKGLIDPSDKYLSRYEGPSLDRLTDAMIKDGQLVEVEEANKKTGFERLQTLCGKRS